MGRPIEVSLLQAVIPDTFPCRRIPVRIRLSYTRCAVPRYETVGNRGVPQERFSRFLDLEPEVVNLGNRCPFQHSILVVFHPPRKRCNLDRQRRWGKITECGSPSSVFVRSTEYGSPRHRILIEEPE